MKGKKNVNKNKQEPNKYRLVVLNEETYEERLSLRLSKFNILAYSILVSLFIMTITTFIIFFTPVREYVPGYDTTAIRFQAIDNLQKLDTLVTELENNEQYILSLKSLLSGEEFENKYQTRSELAKVDISELDIKINIEDSILRKLVEREDKFNVIESEFNPINISLESPVSGFISEKFSITDKHYGIDIVLKEETPVKSVADGIVILSEWTINSGYTVAVYHKNKLMTVYKHNKSSKVSQGDFVQSGQIIALSGNTGELTTGPHLHFELWDDKGPINPEDLISF